MSRPLSLETRDICSRAIEIGKAAEYLVCADLILSGHVAYPTDQGLPYDIILDTGGRLYRVQVRSTMKPKNVCAKSRAPRFAYCWNVRGRGKDRRAALTDECCDLIALVALDTRHIAYVPLRRVTKTVHLAVAGTEIICDGRTAWMGAVDQFPIADALDIEARRFDPPPRNACRRGHPWVADNVYINSRGNRVCKACCKIRYEKRRGR